MGIRWDAPVEGYVGTVVAAALLVLFGFRTSLQIRLDLYGRTVPATLVDSHFLGRSGAVCTYAFMAGAEPQTLKGQCWFVPSLRVDYLPGDAGLAGCHGQPNLLFDVAGDSAALAMLVASIWHLRNQRRSSAGR